jgi:hypothetical protein
MMDGFEPALAARKVMALTRRSLFLASASLASVCSAATRARNANTPEVQQGDHGRYSLRFGNRVLQQNTGDFSGCDLIAARRGRFAVLVR